MAVNTYVSIITLNDSGLNTPIKRQSKRQDKRKIEPPTLGQRTHRLKVRGWTKLFHGNRNSQYSYQTKQTLTKATKKDEKGYRMMIKGTMQAEDFTLVNIYTPNIGAPKYIRQILTRHKCRN